MAFDRSTTMHASESHERLRSIASCFGQRGTVVSPTHESSSVSQVHGCASGSLIGRLLGSVVVAAGPAVPAIGRPSARRLPIAARLVAARNRWAGPDVLHVAMRAGVRPPVGEAGLVADLPVAEAHFAPHNPVRGRWNTGSCPGRLGRGAGQGTCAGPCRSPGLHSAPAASLAAPPGSPPTWARQRSASRCHPWHSGARAGPARRARGHAAARTAAARQRHRETGAPPP